MAKNTFYKQEFSLGLSARGLSVEGRTYILLLLAVVWNFLIGLLTNSLRGGVTMEGQNFLPQKQAEITAVFFKQLLH